MNKKLTAKTQYLNPTLGENIPRFAKAINIEPESTELLLKRGTIFAIFHIEGSASFDTNLVTKVVHDVLHDSYFQSDNISPIQSLEKSIATVRDRVLQLSNETINPEAPDTTFNIIAAVLWGNVMYVVQYGGAQSYLLRSGDIRPINTVAEGIFSAASGIVKDDDVIILCSKEFGKRYPPDKLMTMSIREQDLESEEACILMKYILDKNFSPNEVVDFGIDEKAIKRDSKAVKFLAKKSIAIKAFFDQMRVAQKRREKIKPQTTIALKLKNPAKFSLSSLTKPAVIIPILALTLGISIFFTIKANEKPKAVAPKVVVQTQPTTQESTESTPAVQGAENTQDEEIFYDLKIADINAKPTNIAAFKSTVVVTDQTSGKIYTSSIDTPKFDALSSNYVGINNVMNIKGKLGFTDNQGYKIYDLTTDKLAETYTQTGLGVTSAYLDYVYSINGSELIRYSKNTDTLKPTTWAQTEEFTNAKSLAVAYSVYLITTDGKFVSYTSGKKDTFSLTGDKATLNNPIQIIADIDLKNIYVADAGNKRVVAFDDKGNFVKEYKAKVEEKWNNITSIAVSSDEKTLFVLTGTKIYKMEL